MPTIEQNKHFLDSVMSNLLDDCISWMQDNLDPDDVFDEKKLSAWAEENGYVMKME